MHRCDCNFSRCDQVANHGMKLLEHCGDFARRVGDNIDSCGEAIAVPAKNDSRDFRLNFNVCQSRTELLHHREIDDVEWRIV